MNDVSRRAVLMGAGGLLIAGAQGALPVVGPAGRAPGTVNLEDPAANLAGFIRMMASLVDEDVPWWYNGTVYAITGETQNPQPLFTFEGMELYRVAPLGDGTWELTGNTVTFFRSLAGDWLREFANPFTGATNKVGVAVQGGGPGRGFNLSLQGVRPSKLRDKIPDAPLRRWWSVAAGRVWMNNDTVYPPGLPPPRAQSQSMFATVEQFNNPEVKRIPAVFSSTVTMPWLEWMQMGDSPGHLLWHAAGAKLPGLEALPDDYRKRAEAEFPERLKVARQ